MSQIGKILPNLDQNGTKLLNLTVLQRIDPSIEEILMTAAHVAFYEFNIELNQWSRKDVEGSLFVVKRNAQPRFQFIVMNRRNTDNLIENLSWDFEFELQVPYLLYRNAAQEVSGIWFYNSRECEDAANLFNRIISDCSKALSQPKVSSSKSEFEDLEGVPSMASFGGRLEPQSASRTVTDVEDSAFTNFFNVATNLGNTHSNFGKPGQPHHPSAILSASSMASNLHSSSMSPLQLPSTTAASTVPLVRHHDTSDLFRTSSQNTNLVKPSTFYNPPVSSSSAYMTPPISSMPTAPLQPSTTLQRPYGAPLLQPFPPPNPPPSLTPTNTSNYGPVIDREKVRQALLLLAQDNQFIDMIHQTLQKVKDVYGRCRSRSEVCGRVNQLFRHIRSRVKSPHL